MLQLNPPLVRIIVGGPNWSGPTGKGVANFLEPGHRDDDMIWIIDLDDNGQTWCVPNKFVRAPANITFGPSQTQDARLPIQIKNKTIPHPQATEPYAGDKSSSPQSKISVSAIEPRSSNLKYAADPTPHVSPALLSTAPPSRAAPPISNLKSQI